MIEFLKSANKDKEISNILCKDVKKWFENKFPSFAPPQKYGVMPIHCRENILISSPTGSGKTLTAFLSILNELVDSSNKEILEDRIYAVYISPLKALGQDIKFNLIKPLQEIEKLNNKKYGIRVGVRTGDTTPSERQKMLKNPPHILITTPESIALMLASKKFRENLMKVEWVIIDEIHSMAENKRGVHLSLMLEHLQYYNPGMCRVGLSATVSPLEDVAKYLVGYKRSCKVVDISYIKNLDMKVVSPVNDLVNTEYKEIQEKLYDKIHDYIQSHKTTLIFTNTRAATERIVHVLKNRYNNSYYEMEEDPPFEKASLIGAHHGSLSKSHRNNIEEKLRAGKLKCVVCSTSLELGIDIGSVDLVLLIGSPKSVARALQRAGRAGHQIKSVTKARIIVQDRDDLIECSVLLKNALEHKIDRIHIPQNSYDVLVQHVLGFVINEKIKIKDLFEITKNSYCYKNLNYEDFYEIIKYLAGDYKNLENRYIFSKIFVNEDQTISVKGKLTRMIYTSNLGTIPSQSGISVKIKDYPIGVVEEAFAEKLNKGDRFVLGGDVYEFNFSRGMTIQVSAAPGKSPTIPRWFSETLPLSFDLANRIQKFRSDIHDLFLENKKTSEIIEWIKKEFYVDEKAAKAIHNYSEEEFLFTKRKNKSFFPGKLNLVVENFTDEITETKKFNIKKHYLIFHTLVGRRANEALSRIFAYILGKYHQKDIEIGLNDNGFYLASTTDINPKKVIDLIEIDEFKDILNFSLENTEVVKRRFRQCAERSLMILRSYKGKVKKVGRQQVSSMILLKTAKAISNDFIILRETYREVTEDSMDFENAKTYFSKIKEGSIKIKVFETNIPSPFAVNLILQGYSDIISIGDRHKFLKNVHNMILIKISNNKDLSLEKRKKVSLKLLENKFSENKNKEFSLNESKIKKNAEDYFDSYEEMWDEQEKKDVEKLKDFDFKLKKDISRVNRRKKIPFSVIKELLNSIDKNNYELSEDTLNFLNQELSGTVDKVWTDDLVSHIKKMMHK